MTPPKQLLAEEDRSASVVGAPQMDHLPAPCALEAPSLLSESLTLYTSSGMLQCLSLLQSFSTMYRFHRKQSVLSE